jgi:hypothetical protein
MAVRFIHHPRRQYLLFAAGFGVMLAATAVSPNVAVACALWVFVYLGTTRSAAS